MVQFDHYIWCMKKTILYKRHKTLLALLDTFGGDLNAVDFMKYLLLMSIGKANAYYAFVPYKYGGFSYQAYADKRSLIRKGLLEDCEAWKLTSSGRNTLGHIDRSYFVDCDALHQRYGHLSGDELVRLTYTTYPFYALNSEIASSVLSNSELAVVEKARPVSVGAGLFSIAYEGVSLDEYLVKMFRAGVEVLVDVRKNAFSMKYGFSKKTLQNATENLGIKYLHIPSLGIDNSMRKELNSQADYNKLFDDYKKNILRYRDSELESLVKMVNNGRRIALTCYEANPLQCHRTIVAKQLSKLTGIEVQNL